MRSPPAPDVPTSPKTIMKKPSESSRPVREDSPSRSVSARRQRLPGQGPRYCRCAAIALLDPVSSAVIAEKLDERSQLFGLGQTAQGAHAQQALDPDPAPRTRRRSTAHRTADPRSRGPARGSTALCARQPTAAASSAAAAPQRPASRGPEPAHAKSGVDRSSAACSISTKARPRPETAGHTPSRVLESHRVQRFSGMSTIMWERVSSWRTGAAPVTRWVSSVRRAGASFAMSTAIHGRGRDMASSPTASHAEKG